MGFRAEVHFKKFDSAAATVVHICGYVENFSLRVFNLELFLNSDFTLKNMKS